MVGFKATSEVFLEKLKDLLQQQKLTALFKNAFLVLDLAGKPFGGDFEQLSPCKMKKMFPIARLASGVSTGGCKPQPPAPGTRP